MRATSGVVGEWRKKGIGSYQGRVGGGGWLDIWERGRWIAASQQRWWWGREEEQGGVAREDEEEDDQK